MWREGEKKSCNRIMSASQNGMAWCAVNANDTASNPKALFISVVIPPQTFPVQGQLTWDSAPQAQSSCQHMECIKGRLCPDIADWFIPHEMKENSLKSK